MLTKPLLLEVDSSIWPTSPQSGCPGEHVEKSNCSSVVKTTHSFPPCFHSNAGIVLFSTIYSSPLAQDRLSLQDLLQGAPTMSH